MKEGSIMKFIIGGTAGHIDHGKTELMKALTGLETDRFPEEQERGITIDIGFAPLRLAGDIQIGFIDVPGHEKFVKNMLAGIGGIDFVLLIVAGDESVMPQTEEHFNICKLLEIPHGMTVITKTDLVDQEMVELVREEVEALTAGSFLDGSPIVPVSSRTGEGIEGLKETLLDFCRKIEPRKPGVHFRLPVDRAFIKKGFGTIITGTVISGTAARGAPVELLPSGITTTVRGVEVYNRSVGECLAGQRAAINLQGIEAGEVSRGEVLTEKGVFQSSYLVDLELYLLANRKKPLKNNTRIRFHSGTGEIMGRVKLLEGASLEPGRSCLAQMRLEKPIFTLPGDHFIIRKYSPVITIGGGTVVRNIPPKHRRVSPELTGILTTMAALEPASYLTALLEEAGINGLTIAEVVRTTGFSRALISETSKTLKESKEIHILPGTTGKLVGAAAMEEARQKLGTLMEAFHKKNPLKKGLGREEVRARICEHADQDVFKYLLDYFSATGLIRVKGDMVSHAAFEITLSDKEQQAKDTIEKLFRQAALAPPTPEEIFKKCGTDPETAKKMFYLLIQEKQIVKLGSGLVFHADVLDALITRLRSLKEEERRFGIAEFKTLTSVSRKFAIPLLEYLDREKVTRRIENERIVL